MASGNMKDIKRRIKSVQSTMQITKAMELVASSKMRRAKERALAVRPYFNTMYETITRLARATRDNDSIYTRRREVKNSLFIVIAGDRGLAGGYNSNVLRLAEAQPGEATVLPIGKRAVEHFVRRGAKLLTDEYFQAAEVSVGDCFQMSRAVAGGFLRGEFDAVKVCYTRFASMLTQTAEALDVLPLVLPQPEGQQPQRSLIQYEPNCEDVFNAVIPEYIAGIIYSALCESLASELAARRTAMDAASKNAAEMIENLNLYYNRARQAAITQEITEIVGGAEH